MRRLLAMLAAIAAAASMGFLAANTATANEPGGCLAPNVPAFSVSRNGTLNAGAVSAIEDAVRGVDCVL
jgi:hypothetical protein